MDTIMTSQVLVVPRKLENHDIYLAAAKGDMKQLEDRRSEIGVFATLVAKNTIIHVCIIAQSRRKESFVENLSREMPQNISPFIECLFDRKAARLSAAAAKNVGDMLDLCPSLLWKANAAEDTPLHMAARHGQADIAKVLIDRAKSEGRDVESGTMRAREMLHMVNKGKETALHQAVRYQYNKVVKLLVEEDDPDYKYSQNEDGETPLYMAAERHYKLVKMIVKHYNSPTYEGPRGATALHAAAQDHRSIAGRAIVGKKELEFLTTKVNDRGRTPLHYGAMYLLKHDHSAAFVKDKEGKTALHLLAGKGYKKAVSQFLEECPECFELEDDRGRNALHYAVESGDKDTVEAIRKSEYLGELFKKKDKDGLTPLHLLALKGFYMRSLIRDPRLDKMAYDAKDHTPSDIILTRSTHSRIDMQLYDSISDFGIYSGRRSSLAISESKINNFDQDQTDTKLSEGGIDEDDLKEDRQNHLVVAALIATVTFAAGFTLPGGYNQDEPDIGQAVLRKEKAFQAFVILNTLAMVLSSAAVFIHLLIAMSKKKRLRMAEVSKEKPRSKREKMIADLRLTEVSDLFGKGLPITLIAIVAMVLAFIAGTYAVLSHARVLAIAACATGGLFFGLFWYLWEELFTLSWQVLFGGVFVLYLLVAIPVIVPFSILFIVPFIWCRMYWFPETLTAHEE